MILSEGNHVELRGGELVVTKPLWVEEEASLTFLSPVTLDGEEAFLKIEGAVYSEGLLRICNGGQIQIEDTGSLNSITAVWMEDRERNLVVKGHGSLGEDEQLFLSVLCL